jgi:hypothetical protein
MSDAGLINSTDTKEKRRFQLDITLTPKQKVIDADPRRFKIARCGRKFGKSTLGFYKSIKESGKRNAVVWYIGPTYKQTKRIAWREFKRLMPRDALYKKPTETDLNFTLKNAAELYLMGADEPDSLRGPAPTYVVLEEPAMMQSEVWHEVIRPNLAPHRAPALFIGNPKGLNWYYDLWLDAEKQPNIWGAHHYTIYDNPHIHPEEIEQCRLDCKNDAIWRQEYMAEFESDAGRVFQFNAGKVFVKVRRPQRNAHIFRGIDWGMRDDTACLWGYIEKGVLKIFQEHVQANLAASMQAGIIRAKSTEMICEQSVISHDAFKQDPEMRGVTVAYHFVRAGISPLLKSSRDKAGARDLIQKLMDEGKIEIDPTSCPVLRRQIQKLEWQDTLLEKTEDGDDDTVDALHYLVYMLASRLLVTLDKNKREKKDPEKLYLPERDEVKDAKFTEVGDPV